MRTTIDARAGRLARSTLQTVTIAALLLLTATYATAAEVVITQASVMAAGGFPYTITEPGSYTLGSNLAVPAHTGAIVIKAENVNLNLGGFTIEGPVTCAGRPGPVTSCSPLSPSAFGVFSHGDNITISNGSIVGFAGYGLLLGGQGELVEGVHLKFNGIAGVWLAGGTVRNCSAIRNGNGFQAGEGGAGGGGVLEGNTASFNQFDGFAVAASTVVGNVSSNNGGYGLVGSSVVYGSNSFYNNNAADIGRILNGTSQNNNHCTMTTC
jgi:hypothetical protein